MKSKVIKVFTTSLVFIFSVIGACGCMNNSELNNIQYKDYVDKIEQELSSKYGGSFTVDSIGGTLGSHDDATVKAWCYSNEGDFAGSRFMAEIGKEDYIVKDSYLNLGAASLISDQLIDKYPGDAFILTRFETPLEYPKSGQLDDLQLFITEFDNYFITSFVFIKTEMSNGELSKTIYEYGRKLESLHYKDLSVIVFVADEIAVDEFKTLFTSSEEKYDSIASNEHIKKISGFQLKDGIMQTSSTEIEKEFNKGN